MNCIRKPTTIIGFLDSIEQSMQSAINALYISPAPAFAPMRGAGAAETVQHLMKGFGGQIAENLCLGRFQRISNRRLSDRTTAISEVTESWQR